MNPDPLWSSLFSDSVMKCCSSCQCFCCFCFYFCLFPLESIDSVEQTFRSTTAIFNWALIYFLQNAMEKLQRLVWQWTSLRRLCQHESMIDEQSAGLHWMSLQQLTLDVFCPQWPPDGRRPPADGDPGPHGQNPDDWLCGALVSIFKKNKQKAKKKKQKQKRTKCLWMPLQAWSADHEQSG